jgi:beta-phosphoglucomutase
VNVKAVIFDRDGVLVDTVPFYEKLYMDILREDGIEVKQDEVKARIGEKARNIFSQLLEERGEGDDGGRVTKLYREYRKETNERLENGNLELLPGAREAVGKLKKRKIRVAIGTGASRRSTEIILRKTKAKHLFDAIVTGDDVEKAKPEPDIFLKAAKALGVEPRDCVVVEDWLNGIKAAKKAGMICIAVMGTASSKEELEEAGADLVIGELEELMERL